MREKVGLIIGSVVGTARGLFEMDFSNLLYHLLETSLLALVGGLFGYLGHYIMKKLFEKFNHKSKS